jgi:hypothetical protein
MLLIASVVFSLLALLMLYMVLRQWRKKRWLGMLRYTFLLALFASLTAAAVVVTYSFAMFHNLTYREPVAMISVRAQLPHHYAVTVTLPDGSSQQYALLGDQWLLGANVMVLKPWLQAIGMKNQYQLDFLSSRFNDPETNSTTLLPSYRLSEVAHHAIAAWFYRMAMLPYLIETIEGSAVYMPLKDKAQYQVVLTPSGLLARPL